MPKDNTSFIARFNLDIEISHPLIYFTALSTTAIAICFYRY